MEQDRDSTQIKQDKLYRIYLDLKTQKSSKLNVMRETKRYMRPSYDDIMKRFNEKIGVRELSLFGLFDNTCQNKMSHFSISSLSDIINPYQPWFALNVVQPKEEDVEPLREWAIPSHNKLLDFINKSTYYKALMSDKRDYDLYGFGAMTITHGKDKKGMLIKSENPFSVLIYEDDTGVIGVMWEKDYSYYSMKEKFNYVEKENQKKGVETNKYKVVCCCFPNTSDFIKEPVAGKGNYVQIFLLKKIEELVTDEKGDAVELGSDDSMIGEEIGDRLYFSDLISCIARDSYENDSPYGEGWGKKILISATNLNQVHRNLIKSTEFAGNPAYSCPHDLYRRFKKVQPGQVYSDSATGSKVEPISLDFQIGELNNFLSVEKEQVNESVPVVGMPQQKKQRQSQLEVQKMLLEASKNSFIYKVVYLMEGVGQHLRKMFDIAVEQGVIDNPPNNIPMSDVQPSLSNIILKELKKLEARSFVEALNMSQGFLSLFREGADNYKMDYIIKTIMESVGGGSGLEKNAIVEEIRKKRQEIQKTQQDQQNALAQAQAGLIGAQAGKAQAEGAKAKAEGENQQQL